MAYKNITITPSQYSLQHTAKQSQFYVGFSTAGVDPTVTTLYDFDLIKQDLINQFHTRKGERVMNPTFGTIIWDVLFDPFTDSVKQAIADDVTRICNSDPRAVPLQINITEQEYGMQIEVTLKYANSDQTTNMKLAFDKKSGLSAQ